MSWAFQVRVRLRAVSLFSVVCRVKRETRKWPRAWLMARDGRGCRPRSRVSRLRCSRPRALLSLNLKKKRDCSQSKYVSTWDYIYISYLKWNFMKIPHWKKKRWIINFICPYRNSLWSERFAEKIISITALKAKTFVSFKVISTMPKIKFFCVRIDPCFSHMVAVL